MKKSAFKYNHKDGRCASCNGQGMVRIAMDLMEDVWNQCDVCAGKRYKLESLVPTFEGLSIGDLLLLSVIELRQLVVEKVATKTSSKMLPVLELLIDFGLAHLKLGQSTTSLSGGESQRIKLVQNLLELNTNNALILLDEPSAGLSSKDVHRLMKVLGRYIAKGNTIICVEHDEAIIKAAHYEVKV